MVNKNTPSNDLSGKINLLSNGKKSSLGSTLTLDKDGNIRNSNNKYMGNIDNNEDLA